MKRMVKKKIRKESIAKKQTAKKVSRKDFEVFAQGVERLEELRKELNGLNGSRFPAEVVSIRSKLKNVSYIPQIEKEMRSLKQKIKGTYRKKVVKRKKRDDVHKEIKKLEKKLEKKQRGVNRGKVSSKEKGFINDIPKIESEVKALRDFVKTQKEEEKRKKELLKKIDPSVNLVVDGKFDLTLNEIKAELSKKIKERESEVQKQLQDDLNARKRNFELKYGQLEKRFSERYEDRVKHSLQREMKKRFGDELKKRIESLEGSVRRDYIKKLEYEMKKEFNRRYAAKKLELIKKGKEVRDGLKKDYSQKRVELARMEALDKKKVEEKEEELALEFSKAVDAKKNYIQKDKINIKRFGERVKKLRESLKKEFDKKYVKKRLELTKKNLELTKSGKMTSDDIKRSYSLKMAELVRVEALDKKKIEEKEKRLALDLSKALDAKRKYFQKDKINTKHSREYAMIIAKRSEEQEKKYLLKERISSKHSKEYAMIIAKRSKEHDAVIAKHFREHAEKFKKDLKREVESEKSEFKKKFHQDYLEKKADLVKKEKGDEAMFKREYLSKERKLRERENKFTLELSKIIEEKRKFIEEGKINIKISRQSIDDLKERIKKEFESKGREIQASSFKELINEKMKLRQHFQEELLANRVMMNNKLHEHLTLEVKKLHKEHDIKAKVERQKIIDMKKKLTNETGILSKIKNSLNVDLRKVRADGEEYKKKLEERLENEKRSAVERGVAKQSDFIKKQLQREFDDRLRLELQKKQADFDKKKASLNLEIQAKMKQMLS